MVRLSLVLGAASAAALASATHFEQRDISGMWDDNTAMMKRFEDERSALVQRASDLSSLENMMNNPNWWAEASDMNSASSPMRPNTFGNINVGVGSPTSSGTRSTSTDSNGNTVTTINSSKSNNVDLSNNTGYIKMMGVQRRAPRRKHDKGGKKGGGGGKGQDKPKKDAAPPPGASPAAPPAATPLADKTAKAPTPAPSASPAAKTDTTVNNKAVTNSNTSNNISMGNTSNNVNDSSLHNLSDMENNSGSISNSGNTYGEFNGCSVMIEERSFVESVLEARKQKNQDGYVRRDKFGKCACNCGNRKRSLPEPAPHARSFDAVLERSCSIVQGQSGVFGTLGQCSRSTLAGRDIRSILPAL